MAMTLKCIFIAACIAYTQADIYLHNPRGSNNRLNGRNRDRTNANRLFDSQNNARGGYNVGNLYYYAGSKLPIQWTNQHSCSDPNNNCEIVVQYMCNDKLRDGTTETTIPDDNRRCKLRNCDTDTRFGMHEDFRYYETCKRRQRNKGLFLADQNLKGDTAKYTRQNAAGTRRGYECPEERDYYPYWHPTPWKDIVVMTNDVKRCNYYKNESENVKTRWACKIPPAYFTCAEYLKNLEIPNNKEQCEKIRYPPGDPSGEKAVWYEYPANGDPAPDCILSPWSRDNHNGNGRNGYMNVYNWTVPKIEAHSCVMRIRYNISTNDYDSWNTFASSEVSIGKHFGLNEEDAKNRGYRFQNNPVVTVSKESPRLKLRLAINTAQYGRTFQDRSHVFSIEKPPEQLKNAVIHNVNVRGKRGNIVQTYPAMEYDFVPNKLHVNTGEYVHFQWTGSDHNPQNNDGEGNRGTDRSNVIPLADPVFDEGKPKVDVFGQYGRNYPHNVSTAVFLGLPKENVKRMAILHPGAGPLFNEAGTYYDARPQKVTRNGIFFYMCTRNNNFSNRSQKGKIVVKVESAVKKKVAADEPEVDDASLEDLDSSMKETNDDVKAGEAGIQDKGSTENSKRDGGVNRSDESGEKDAGGGSSYENKIAEEIEKDSNEIRNDSQKTEPADESEKLDISILDH